MPSLRARRITKWTVQDGEHVSRIAGYINESLDCAPIISIADEELCLALHVDADGGGRATGDQQSTSGAVAS